MAQQNSAEIALRLATLYHQRFGGKRTGRFRISRRYLLELSGRRRLPERLLRDVANEMFEQGFVLIDLESFFVVLDQKLFVGYRRVTRKIIGKLATLDGEEKEIPSNALTIDDGDTDDK